MPDSAAEQSPALSGAPLPEVLKQVRGGSREAAAELGVRFAPEIRRRIRGQLGTEMRGLFDSNDIMATVFRRLDQYVQNHSIRANSEREVRALLLKICQNAVTDKSRIARRLRTVEGEDAAVARSLAFAIEEERTTHADDEEGVLTAAFEHLRNDVDRKILWFWLKDQQLARIAEHLDLQPAHVRKRWQLIRSALAELLESRS